MTLGGPPATSPAGTRLARPAMSDERGDGSARCFPSGGPPCWRTAPSCSTSRIGKCWESSNAPALAAAVGPGASACRPFTNPPGGSKTCAGRRHRTVALPCRPADRWRGFRQPAFSRPPWPRSGIGVGPGQATSSPSPAAPARVPLGAATRIGVALVESICPAAAGGAPPAPPRAEDRSLPFQRGGGARHRAAYEVRASSYEVAFLPAPTTGRRGRGPASFSGSPAHLRREGMADPDRVPARAPGRRDPPHRRPRPGRRGACGVSAPPAWPPVELLGVVAQRLAAFYGSLDALVVPSLTTPVEGAARRGPAGGDVGGRPGDRLHQQAIPGDRRGGCAGPDDAGVPQAIAA